MDIMTMMAVKVSSINQSKMKRIIISLLLAAISVFTLTAQDMNASGDNIIGKYYTDYGDNVSRIEFRKEKDGTYTAQIYWCKNTHDKEGKLKTDIKNPDKSLRNVPVDKIVLISGLKYNKDKKRWDGGKIYDPTRGIRVNATCTFTDAKSLKIRGTVMGIGETLVWKKEN